MVRVSWSFSWIFFPTINSASRNLNLLESLKISYRLINRKLCSTWPDGHGAAWRRLSSSVIDRMRSGKAWRGISAWLSNATGKGVASPSSRSLSGMMVLVVQGGSFEARYGHEGHHHSFLNIPTCIAISLKFADDRPLLGSGEKGNITKDWGVTVDSTNYILTILGAR